MMSDSVTFELKTIRFDSHTPVIWAREQSLSFLPPKGTIVELAFNSPYITSVIGFRLERLSHVTMRTVIEMQGFVILDQRGQTPKWDRTPKLWQLWNTEHMGDLEEILRNAFWEVRR